MAAPATNTTQTPKRRPPAPSKQGPGHPCVPHSASHGMGTITPLAVSLARDTPQANRAHPHGTAPHSTRTARHLNSTNNLCPRASPAGPASAALQAEPSPVCAQRKQLSQDIRSGCKLDVRRAVCARSLHHRDACNNTRKPRTPAGARSAVQHCCTTRPAPWGAAASCANCKCARAAPSPALDQLQYSTFVLFCGPQRRLPHFGTRLHAMLCRHCSASLRALQLCRRRVTPRFATLP